MKREETKKQQKNNNRKTNKEKKKESRTFKIQLFHAIFILKRTITRVSENFMVLSERMPVKLIPRWQILIPRTSRGRPLPTSLERLLKILFNHPEDVPIWRPKSTSQGRPLQKGFQHFPWRIFRVRLRDDV